MADQWSFQARKNHEAAWDVLPQYLNFQESKVSRGNDIFHE
jgi:hypothetical protein